jgi:hypothetical protein
MRIWSGSVRRCLRIRSRPYKSAAVFGIALGVLHSVSLSANGIRIFSRNVRSVGCGQWWYIKSILNDPCIFGSIRIGYGIKLS